MSFSTCLFGGWTRPTPMREKMTCLSMTVPVGPLLGPAVVEEGPEEAEQPRAGEEGQEIGRQRHETRLGREQRGDIRPEELSVEKIDEERRGQQAQGDQEGHQAGGRDREGVGKGNGPDHVKPVRRPMVCESSCGCSVVEKW